MGRQSKQTPENNVVKNNTLFEVAARAREILKAGGVEKKPLPNLVKATQKELASIAGVRFDISKKLKKLFFAFHSVELAHRHLSKIEA